MKRVAIPIVDTKLSEYFGACSHYEVFDIEGKSIQKRIFELPGLDDVAKLLAWLEKQGITDVITYRINKKLISLFAAKKVNLFVGVPLNLAEKLIGDYLQGRLESDKIIIEEITN